MAIDCIEISSYDDTLSSPYSLSQAITFAVYISLLLTVIYQLLFMKQIFLLASMGVLFFSAQVSAQRINTDSLKLVSKISEDQFKLGKLQNTVDQKTRDKQDGATKAQESANKNATDATRLSNDPENKKDAAAADNAAGAARSDARKARKTSANLDKVNKNISDLQSKISDEKIQLSRYTGVPVPVMTPVAVAQPDTTQHQ